MRKIRYWFQYQIAGLEFEYGRLCGKIVEWFLWQEWKQCVYREDFEAGIRRLRGSDKFIRMIKDSYGD